MADSAHSVEDGPGLVDVSADVEASAAADPVQLSIASPEVSGEEEEEEDVDESSLSDEGSDSGRRGGEDSGSEEGAEELAAVPMGSQPDVGSETASTDTESDTEDSEPYQKLDLEARDSFLDRYHPEARVQNFEEVRLRTRVVRDAHGWITDPEHRTVPFLTKYELTRVLGLRARQIDTGAQPFVQVPGGVLDGYTIAEAELEQKKIPFILRRPMPGGTSEYWRLEDLELLRAPAGLGLQQATAGTSTSSGSHS
jgi:DNA-directed RNA polymerase I, II, and III subunit RPABC2